MQKNTIKLSQKQLNYLNNFKESLEDIKMNIQNISSSSSDSFFIDIKNNFDKILEMKNDHSNFEPSMNFLKVLEIQNNYHAQNFNNLSQNISIITDELIDIENQIKYKNISISVLEKLKNYKLESKKQFILNIINTALKDIFQDDIKIDIVQDITKTGKIKYNIVLFQNDIMIGKNDELINTSGGGVLSIISVLFKILIGYLYSKNKFYIFDESFSQVSPEYRERLSSFLRKFAEKYNFTIIIVSQTSDLNTHAHLLYKVNFKYKNDLRTLYIEDIQENIDDSKSFSEYSVKIKNFQSIDNIEFKYKGLTMIVGPNNSGKSASLRAIRSIMFNDFQEKFLRKGAKTSEIIFSKNENDEENIIKLIYKSKKVIYEIKGEQYLGKNLAADVLKDELEKIGFKSIDIKKLYKNMKGDIRTQTERMAYASQYDNLFLIGNKSNDIEKVFNFLFNTENITQAIVEFKEEILELNNIYKDKSIRLQEYQNEFKTTEYKLKIIDTIIQFLTINIYMKLNSNVNIINKIINDRSTDIKKIEKKLIKYKKISDGINSVATMLSIMKNIGDSRKIIEINSNIINKINKLNINEFKNKINNLKYLKTIIDNYNEFIDKIIESKIRIKCTEIDLDKINSVNDTSINSKIENVIKLQEFISTIKILNDSITSCLNKKHELLNNIDNVNNEIESLGVCVCDKCSGTGIIFKQGD